MYLKAGISKEITDFFNISHHTWRWISFGRQIIKKEVSSTLFWRNYFFFFFSFLSLRFFISQDPSSILKIKMDDGTTWLKTFLCNSTVFPLCSRDWEWLSAANWKHHQSVEVRPTSECIWNMLQKTTSGNFTGSHKSFIKLQLKHVLSLPFFLTDRPSSVWSECLVHVLSNTL